MSMNLPKAIRYIGYGVLVLAFGLFIPEIQFQWFDFSQLPEEGYAMLQYGALFVSLGFMAAPLLLEVFEGGDSDD